MSDTIDLDELERLAKAATPGPWIFVNVGYTFSQSAQYSIEPSPGVSVWEHNRKDADYIAAANPATVLALIARVRKAEARGVVHDAEWTRQMVASAEQFRAEAEAERDEWRARAERAEALADWVLHAEDAAYLSCADTPFCGKGEPWEHSDECVVRHAWDVLAPERKATYGGSTVTFLQPIAGMAHEDDGGTA